MFSIANYTDIHFEGVAALWREAFPNDASWNAAHVAIPEKVKWQPDLLLVAIDAGCVVGSIMAGYDGHRGWISRIAVLRSHQHQGVGRALIKDAETRLGSLGCKKINLQVVASNSSVLGFYKSLGYEIEERVSMSKRLSPN